MQTGRKYLAPEEIKFKNKCELCNKDKRTGNFKFQNTCPKNNCNKKDKML